jgi:WD40 repeat protein
LLLLTGSAKGAVKKWSFTSMEPGGLLKFDGLSRHFIHQGSLVLEDEMNLDGPVTALYFDALLLMGVVWADVFQRSSCTHAQHQGRNCGWLYLVHQLGRAEQCEDCQRSFRRGCSLGLIVNLFKQTQILDLKISPQGKYALTSGADGSIRVWSIGNMEQVMMFQPPPQPSTAIAANCVAFSRGVILFI